MLSSCLIFGQNLRLKAKQPQVAYKKCVFFVLELISEKMASQGRGSGDLEEHLNIFWNEYHDIEQASSLPRHVDDAEDTTYKKEGGLTLCTIP